MLIHSYSPAGCKFISRLQAYLFLFSVWCDSSWPWGKLCWKNWPWHLSMLLLALLWEFGCALYFGSLWLWRNHYLQCEFILLSTVVFHLGCLLKQTAWLHQTAAVTGHQLCWCSELTSHHPFLHDVMSHWSSIDHLLCMDLGLKIHSLRFYHWLFLRVEHIVLMVLLA